MIIRTNLLMYTLGVEYNRFKVLERFFISEFS
jgi:hypothetical protein